MLIEPRLCNVFIVCKGNKIYRSRFTIHISYYTYRKYDGIYIFYLSSKSSLHYTYRKYYDSCFLSILDIYFVLLCRYDIVNSVDMYTVKQYK